MSYKNRPPARAAASSVRGNACMGSAAAAAQRSNLRGMNAWQMHQHILHNFTRFYGSGSSSAVTLSQQTRPSHARTFVALR